MLDQYGFMNQLDSFLFKFEEMYEQHEKEIGDYNEMEKVIGDYTSFILDPENEGLWTQVAEKEKEVLAVQTDALREQSCLCVCAMEKYRAQELQREKADIADYFKNVEACIENEFGRFKINSKSKVLLIGSGAFPMTPLLVSRKTGAEVVGIDIDPEAISLGKTVINILDKDARISISDATIDQLDFTREATHVIICSIIKEKYDLLHQLHSLTRDDVVVSMRYGDGIKSLFNYPLRETDPGLWEIVHQTAQQESVFDIALYKKCK